MKLENLIYFLFFGGGGGGGEREREREREEGEGEGLMAIYSTSSSFFIRFA